MMVREDYLLKEVLGKIGSKVKFASIFGSHGRGEIDRFSDVDILIVCEDETDKTAISNNLTRLGSKIKRDLHVNILTSKRLEHRVRSHDYLTASILDDSRLIFGDEGAFFTQKSRILTGTPNAASIEFNKRVGLEILDRASNALWQLLLNSPPNSLEPGNMRNSDLLRYLRDYHLGIGYLIASEKMERVNRVMTLRRLLTFNDALILRDIILREKEALRSQAINPEEIRDMLDYSRHLLKFQKIPS